MTPETFESLRSGTDKRPWIVVGGPLDGKKVDPRPDMHICLTMKIPIVDYKSDGGIRYLMHEIDHDGHVLEFIPT